MDCEKLDAMAIDLVYDELDDRGAEEAAQHLVGCVRCTALIERLRTGRKAADELPLEDPSSLLEARIFAAASQVKGAAPWPRRVVRAVTTAGAYAMRPQVAMAAVLLLMVGSSVLLLRNGGPSKRTRVTDEGTPVASLEQPSPGGPLGEGQGAPAGIVGRAEKLRVTTPTSEAAPSTAATVAGGAGGDEAAKEAKSGEAKGGKDLEEAPKEKEKDAPADKSATLSDGKNDNGKSDGDDFKTLTKSGASKKKAESAGAVAQSSPPAPAATTTAAAPMAAPTSAVGGVVATPGSFDDSMTAYKEGRYASASKGFDAAAAAGTKPSTSYLYAARSWRAAGSCAQALSRFQKVLSGYATSTDAPYAAIEGGDCAKQTGDVVTAKTLYERAKSWPQTKDRAEKALAELNKPPAAAPPAKAAKPSVDATETNK